MADSFHTQVVGAGFAGAVMAERLASRITEYRHFFDQRGLPASTLHVDYPQSEGAPCYPIPNDETRTLYKRYEALAAERSDVTFVGRLARYRLMDSGRLPVAH